MEMDKGKNAKKKGGPSKKEDKSEDTNNPPVVASTSTGTIKKKRDEKHRKRDPRSVENVKKAINAFSEEEKLHYVFDKYSDIYEENRSLYASVQNLQKAFTDATKERDRDQADLTKAILAKGHLETLCRELQKQNKQIREENLTRIKEEEERRREIATNFNESLNALTNLMTESKDKSNQVKQENESMSDRLSELCVQFQARENHLEALNKQMDLQKELYEATIKKNDLTFKSEKETMLKEKAVLAAELQKSELKINVLQEKVVTMETHLGVYKSQYADFEETMMKSNRVFGTVKDELERVAKQAAAFEKERNSWKNRWQSSAQNLINVSEQHNALQQEFENAEKRICALQKLCRRIQTERLIYLQKLKDSNIPTENLIIPTAELDESQDDAPAEKKPSDSMVGLIGLKKDIQKIQAETKAAQKTQVAEQKTLTAKEELLKVLKGELATLQKEVGDGGGDAKPNAGPSKKNKNRKALKKKPSQEEETTTTDTVNMSDSPTNTPPETGDEIVPPQSPEIIVISDSSEPSTPPEEETAHVENVQVNEVMTSSSQEAVNEGASTSVVAATSSTGSLPPREFYASSDDYSSVGTVEALRFNLRQLNEMSRVYEVGSTSSFPDGAVDLGLFRIGGVGVGDGQPEPVNPFDPNGPWGFSHIPYPVSAFDSASTSPRNVDSNTSNIPEASTIALANIDVQTDNSRGEEIPIVDVVNDSVAPNIEISFSFEYHSPNLGGSRDAGAQMLFSRAENVPLQGILQRQAALNSPDPNAELLNFRASSLSPVANGALDNLSPTTSGRSLSVGGRSTPSEHSESGSSGSVLVNGFSVGAESLGDLSGGESPHITGPVVSVAGSFPSSHSASLGGESPHVDGSAVSVASSFPSSHSMSLGGESPRTDGPAVSDVSSLSSPSSSVGGESPRADEPSSSEKKP